MAAVGTAAAMPSRPYSPRIVGPVWPQTSPEQWLETAEALNQKSIDLLTNAATIRRAADELGASNLGQMIEAMCERSYRTAQTIINQSDMYADSSKAVKETGELIWHACGRLDEIDRKAHDEIDRLKRQFAAAASSPLGAGAAAAALYSAIDAVVSEAEAEALAAATDTTAAITEQAASIGGGNSGGLTGSSGDAAPMDTKEQGGPGGGRAMADGMPFERLPSTRPTNYGADDNQSLNYGTNEGETATSDRSGFDGPESSVSEGDRHSDGTANNQPAPAADGDINEAGNLPGSPITPTASEERLGIDGPLAVMPPAAVTPAGGGGVSSGGSGVGGGLKMPGARGFSGDSSVSSVSNAGGLNSPAELELSPTTSTGGGLSMAAASAGTPTPSSDFSRGFNAGLAGGGSVLPPPVTPPPAQPANSTAGAYGSASAGGTPSVPAAGGPVAHSVPPAAAGTAPSAGTLGTPMVAPMPAPGGPLPPFNSDIAPRQVSAAAAAASAPPGAPAAPPSPAAGGPGTPLPPGVVASGGAAAATGAVAGTKSAAPDPLLADALALVEELMKASRQYGTIDWCVGVFKTPAKTLTVVTSGEGAGFIPAGVHLPKGVELLFSDSGLDNAFRRRWFGWINPAQTMVAYAQSVTALNPNIELWAIAVSTGFGGSAQPARAAGVPHYADCHMPTDSPLGGGVVQPPLDETRLHRLEALNPAAYAQLNTATPVDVRESLTITRQTAHVTFTQASELLTLPIPPLLREIATHLDRGSAITESLWGELASAVLPMAITDSSGQRPGRLGTDTEASSYARVHHNLARLAELLLLWRHGIPDHREVVYLAHHIAAERELWAGHENGGAR
ncbi:MAG: chemotaxis protein [Mycobacterium sp.]|nr:chemotaxis protein [Mycobacterium sp.]